MLNKFSEELKFKIKKKSIEIFDKREITAYIFVKKLEIILMKSCKN